MVVILQRSLRAIFPCPTICCKERIATKLIDAEKLERPIYAEEDNITGMGMSPEEMEGYNDAIDMMWDRIQRAPVVDAEVVTRCKDCGNYLLYTDGRPMNFCTVHKCDMYDDTFCSYGEPKEVNQ